MSCNCALDYAFDESPLMVVEGGSASPNDPLFQSSTSMGWDCLNRMTSLTNSSGSWIYNYRADGMRVSKTNGTNGTLYRYDGQMQMEDVDTGSNPAVTDYAIGARGIDAISKTSGGHTVVVYPIYDSHGNMMADVSRSGSGFSINDKRSYDAWGNIRSGASTGDPKGRYCANLGHVEDDESNLIYMRARYYDPTSGRFISEDPAQKGHNWCSYSNDDPINYEDKSGKDPMSTEEVILVITLIARDLGISLPSWFRTTDALISDVLLALKSYGISQAMFRQAQAAQSCGSVLGLLGFSDLSIEFYGFANGHRAMGAASLAVGALALYNAAVQLDLILLDEDPSE